MASNCHECGAELSDGATCKDHFHRLLVLESEVAAVFCPASIDQCAAAHFHAVSAYILQHPEAMNYTAEALAGARQGLAEHLAGRVTIAQQLQRVRRAADGPTRITRRLVTPSRAGRSIPGPSPSLMYSRVVSRAIASASPSERHPFSARSKRRMPDSNRRRSSANTKAFAATHVVSTRRRG